MQNYIPTIGLEIHAELKTNSKMFCSCANNPDEDKPNKNICPICLGHPGTLPVLNYQAIKHVLRLGVAIDGSLADFTEWDRKNYFYPDIPKGYQISQYKFPLVSDGSMSGVQIERIHLEEDTAKSTHDTHEKSLVNFNRAGVPLMELVTKPVIRDAKTAVIFAQELQLLLRYLGAGEANMEKGEMRVEANISVASPVDTEAGHFGTKTEVKNLNSFRAVERAIAYEIERQIDLLNKGEKVIQETRGWDENKNETYSQRSKESSHDYRYFPDPDIPKLKIGEITQFDRESLQESLPELPWTKRDRYKREYQMTDKEVAVFVESPSIARYFEAIISSFDDEPQKIKLTTNYILTDYLGLLKKKVPSANLESSIDTIPQRLFTEMIELIHKGDISSRGAKDLLNIIISDERLRDSSAIQIAKTHNLIQESDVGSLEPIIDNILSQNTKVVSEYKAGKTTSLQYLIGQAMKATKGSSNPEVVKKLLLEKLG